MQMICIASIPAVCYNANHLHMNIRLTKKRQQILSVLQSSEEALSASGIHEALPDIDLVTIYRNLDLFTEEGLVKRLQFSDEALYEYQATPHHHAICDDCQKMIHFAVPEKELKKLIQLKGFTIEDIDITVKGKCAHETR